MDNIKEYYAVSQRISHKILLIYDSYIWRDIALHLKMLFPDFLLNSGLKFDLLCSC